MKLQKLAAALLACCLTMSLAACGGNPAPVVNSGVVPGDIGIGGAPGATAAPGDAAQSVAASSDASSENAVQTVADTAQMKGIWISFLEWAKVDFSSADSFTSDFTLMCDNCVSIGVDTLFVQVRPYGDALYKSSVYPWSSLLTGTQGTDPGYDPLAIMVDIAHSNGLAIQAWVNPYRVRLSATNPAGELSADNPALLHPDWVKAVDEGLYLDPSSADVRALIVEGVREIAAGYDVDGIQFDDYFYPTTDAAFDEAEYLASGAGLEVAEWRRSNVDKLVQDVYTAVHAAKADCVFGISPQGNPDNNYNGQYSDVNRWLSTPGYVDYILPQVYWGYGYTLGSGSTRFAFENITAEWLALPKDDSVSLYFGLGTYRIGDGDGGSDSAQWNTGHSMADQIADLNARNAQGWALYRYDFLFNNSAWPDLAAAECAALAEG